MVEQQADMKDELKRAVELTRAEEFEEALEIFNSHLLGMTTGSINEKRFAAGTLYYYGLCVAMVKRRYSEGVKYCRLSVKANMFDPEHRYNLARVYVERGNRRQAFEALNAGLQLEPHHKRLNRLLDQIGRRRPPLIPLLGRDNPINVWLGKMARREQKD